MFLKKIRLEDGAPYAFEARNGYISFRTLVHCISDIAGVRFTNEHVSFLGQDNHADFLFKGHEFTIRVPFSDFWVGPKDTESSYPEIEEIEDYVNRHAITARRRKLWDFLSFDFKSLFTARG